MTRDELLDRMIEAMRSVDQANIGRRIGREFAVAAIVEMRRVFIELPMSEAFGLMVEVVSLEAPYALNEKLRSSIDAAAVGVSWPLEK